MLKFLMPSLKDMVTSDYNVIKTMETEKIINDSLKGLTSSLSPRLLQISGIPGAGKSTFCATHHPKNYLLLSFDKIMLQLSGYQRDLKEKGAEAAFEKHEMPARIIGYELFRRALVRRYNIMFEHSGTNKAHLELFKNIAKFGYKTEVNFLVCDKDIATQRIHAREKETGRHTPDRLIQERAENFKQYISAYSKLTPSVTLLDGTNNFSILKKI